MIRKFIESDLPAVMQIWLDSNIIAHNFIPKCYWLDNYDMVKELLPQAEIYVYEDETTKQTGGFIGITGRFIAGLFVKEDMQSKGIGKQLLDHAKGEKSNLSLNVYKKNTRAVHFYLREQFVIRAEKTDDNTGETELIMTWDR